ncbi:MAG: twin-arginine translocase subunit TatC [Trebonia sp.]|jgi:sec-independent protein translocase protein TatC
MASKPTAIRGARVVGSRYLRLRRQANPDGRMPLMDHLRELRNRVVTIAVVVLVGAGVAWAFYNQIWSFVQRPYCQAVNGCHVNVPGHSLILNGVMDGFYLHIKVSVIAAIVVTSPIWLYQLWAFIAPGLYSREKRWTYLFMGTAVPLFALGCCFAFIAMSRGLKFFIGMSGGLTNLFTADTYIGYWIAMIIGFGLCFEVPLFLVILNLARVVTHERFKKWRKIIIFLVFVFAGIASPSPDPLTMLLLGGVVVLLVEAAEVIIFFNDRRYTRLHPDLNEGLADDELSPIDTPERVDVDSSLN